MRKLRIFWMNHWLKFVITTLLIALVILTFVGLSSLESFYRNLTLATIPLQLLLTGLNAFIFVYFYMLVMGKGFGGLRKDTQVEGGMVKVRFKDVIGLESGKREAMEVVELLKDRARLKAIGGQIVKGVLMVGPPGTGKTLMAKAIAGESGVPFLTMAGSEFVEVFVGVGSKRVRALFKKARQLAYAHGACIIFLDELDVIGQKRQFSAFGSQEKDSTLNQLLVEMDGLGNESVGGNIVVIGATNAGEEVLDKALLRPGRFDRKIFIDRPNLEERVEIFKYYLKKVKFDPTIDVGRLARKTVFKSPAEIMNIVKEGALIATRNGRMDVTYKDLSQAIERIEMGVAHRLNMAPQEREAVAYHETGHLMVLYQLHPTDDVFKASIISRGGALGVVHHQPREELHTSSRDKILADIKVALGGYCAEKIKYGVTSSGVSSDFTAAMHQAHQMVWRLGMGTNGFVGDFSAIPEDELSDKMKEALNNETHQILSRSAKEVEEFLRKEWTLVDRFAQELLKRDELEYDDIHAIFAEYGKARQQVPIETVTLAEEKSSAAQAAAPAPAAPMGGGPDPV
jgi:cell division protease FtsH